MTLFFTIEIQTFRKGDCEMDRVFKPIEISIGLDYVLDDKTSIVDFFKLVRWLLLLKTVR